MSRGNFQDDVGVEREILMGDQVAQPGRPYPVFMRKCSALDVGQLFDGDADDLQIEQHGIKGCLVVDKRLDRVCCRHARDFLGRRNQVIKIEKPVT